MINWWADEQPQKQGFKLDLDDVKLTRMISRLMRVRKQGLCFFLPWYKTPVQGTPTVLSDPSRPHSCTQNLREPWNQIIMGKLRRNSYFMKRKWESWKGNLIFCQHRPWHSERPIHSLNHDRTTGILDPFLLWLIWRLKSWQNQIRSTENVCILGERATNKQCSAQYFCHLSCFSKQTLNWNHLSVMTWQTLWSWILALPLQFCFYVCLLLDRSHFCFPQRICWNQPCGPGWPGLASPRHSRHLGCLHSWRWSHTFLRK